VDRAFRRIAPRRRGFRLWLLENYRLLYTLDLIAAYASLMAYFASLVLAGGPSILSKIALGILIGSAGIAALPFAVRSSSANVDGSFRSALLVRRSKKTVRVEVIVAAVLWTLIAIVVVSIFLGFHVHLHR